MAKAIPSPRHRPENFGLHANALGAFETLAQSVSAMAPSTSASLTIPLVFALAGNATWFVYLLATATTLLVGSCIARFARVSASPGSLYSYASDALPPLFGVIAGWALLIAYVATGASVTGGALYYVNLFAQQFFHAAPPGFITLAVVCGAAGLIAYRDVKLSAEVMLWVEFVSLALVLAILAAILIHRGIHIDRAQFELRGTHVSAIGPALVLAIFSFAGFESATTLGGEAHNPLRTIPRAVLQCATLAGVLFILCSYAEVLGFRGLPTSLSESTSPLHLLAEHAGVSALGIGVDLGAAISMFACVLACATAASRVLLRMSANRVLPAVLQRVSPVHGTPGVAIALACGLMFAGTCLMALRSVSGFEMYDLAGSLSVFGFLSAYVLVALAGMVRFRREGTVLVLLTGVITIAVICMVAVFDIRSAADVVHARIPFLYAALIAAGLLSGTLRRSRVEPASDMSA